MVTEHRLGFAWAGSLDEEVLGPTLDEARDNAAFATPDEHVRLAVPDGVAPVAVDLWDPGLASVPTTAKVELALALEAQARGADPRIRQVDARRLRGHLGRDRARVDDRDPGHRAARRRGTSRSG